MSEPNDTAQEGFDQLKRNLEVRYPEDSDLSLNEFLNVESLLALAVRVCGPGADPRKADRLLSNYQLIRPETIGADGHLMQMARRHLFSLASSTAWRRLLGLYEPAKMKWGGREIRPSHFRCRYRLFALRVFRVRPADSFAEPFRFPGRESDGLG